MWRAPGCRGPGRCARVRRAAAFRAPRLEVRTAARLVSDFIERCRRDVPFYLNRLAGDPLPTYNLDDLRREPWSFVPDSADVSELIVFPTSGTTGNLIPIPPHPVAPARYLPLFQSALAAHGGVADRWRSRVGDSGRCASADVYGFVIFLTGPAA
jgi:hypothetical protein